MKISNPKVNLLIIGDLPADQKSYILRHTKILLQKNKNYRYKKKENSRQ